MPAAMPPTLAPGVMTRDSLAGAGVGSTRAREALAAAAAAVSAERARAREANLRRRFQLALNTQLSQSIFASNQIQLRYKWVDGRMVGAWPTPRWDWVSGREAAHAQFPLPRDPLSLPAFELPVRYHESPTPPNHFMRMDLHQGIPGGARNAVSGSGLGAGPASTSGAVGVGAAVLALAALVLLARAFERCLDQRLFKRIPGGARNAVSGSGLGAGPASTSGEVGVGAAVLAFAALMLLARAFERCLEQRLFKLLRRRSNEWVTPNVLATSSHVTDESPLETPTMPPGDPPPPYAMCVLKRPPVPSIADPPPPYSACYVAFGGPQDPAPRVHLNGPTLSFRDTGQTETDNMDNVPALAVTAEEAERGGEPDTPAERSSRDTVAPETSARIQVV